MGATVKSERITQRCPGCGRDLRIPPELEGQKVLCKFCDHEVVVGLQEKVEPERGLSHAGTGPAFQIERTWTAGPDAEARYTIIRHPLKQRLRGFTMAVECHGPARVQMAGIQADSGKAIRLGRVRPGEIKLVPLDDLYRAYLWLDKGTTTSVKVIVARTVR